MLPEIRLGYNENTEGNYHIEIHERQNDLLKSPLQRKEDTQGQIVKVKDTNNESKINCS